MSRDVDPDLLNHLMGDQISPVLFGRIGTDAGDVRMWTGYGTLPWGGFDWLGGGEFIGISEVEETEDVQANGLVFTMSGIPTDLLLVTIASMRQGLPGELFVGALSDSGALIGEPYSVFTGGTDVPIVDDPGDTVTISVTVESDLVDIERPRIRRMTDEDQKSDYPDDKGFEFVNGLQEAEITWGQIG
ncbi:hypothetical protein [Thalassospira sp.]|uniref:hypothetical protein n=1 Tax=Thalassospira sp. TaxID=1912094 RepID=UPI000C5A9E40|nr:hypothetical protein [Thalassospira sp.]MBC05726.1 hypothetical protein [Thalassospira sp.]